MAFACQTLRPLAAARGPRFQLPLSEKGRASGRESLGSEAFTFPQSAHSLGQPAWIIPHRMPNGQLVFLPEIGIGAMSYKAWGDLMNARREGGVVPSVSIVVKE